MKSKIEVEAKLSAYLTGEKRLEDFYKDSTLSCAGYFDWCYEVIVENNVIDKLDGIQEHTRMGNYNRESLHRKALKPDRKRTGREEEWTVIDMFLEKDNKHKEVFGQILDYQVPLKDKQTDHFGKIDFVSLHDGQFYIVEIKAQNSNESILKAIFEVETYYRIVNKQKLLKDFGREESTVIKKIVAIGCKSKAFAQYNHNNNRVKALCEKLDIKVITY